MKLFFTRRGRCLSRRGGILAAATLAAATLVSAPVADAGITGQGGSVIVTAPLPDVRPGASENDAAIRMFLERSEQVLPLPLLTDAALPGLYDDILDLPAEVPVIAAGTKVDSYLLHADVVGEPTFGPTLLARVGFDRDILGVIMQGATLDATDLLVGAEGTTYLNGRQKRGIEWEAKQDSVKIVDARTVEVSFNINTVVDEVRIITAGTPAGTVVVPVPTPTGLTTGYRFVASDGGVFSFGNRGFFGSTGDMTLNQPVVAGGETSTARGYWLIARDGGVFSFGDAKFFGSTGAIKLNQPIVAMASTPEDAGYWLFASDGGVFNYGNAGFEGSMGKTKLNQPIVGAAATPSGKGYWMVAADGGIFSFGDAEFQGSTGAIKLNQPIVGMAPTPTGQGYWLVASDGGIFTFGDAVFLGSTG
ncbi:MAG TPA: hypothetical protein VI854_04775, partial [Acidimicrobiia bacterium]|nr:hypothetical protein [Acidimicrobiia bacterium]